MLNGTVGQVVKRSLLYSYVLSQPLAVNVDAYPVLENNMLLEAESMQYSEHGQVVRVVQQKLQKLSYYDDEIDGEYGVFTEHSLKKFQKDHHIKVNGRTDLTTKIELIRVERKRYIDQLEELSGSVYPGMYNEDVEIVQEALKYLGYYEGDIDGIYGPFTKEGLETAEDEHGISLTDEVTEEAMKQLYDKEETIEENSLEENGPDDESEAQTGSEKNEAEETSEVETTQEENDTAFADQSESEADSSNEKSIPVKSNVNTSVVETAKNLIGTPYVWGGDTTSGFDCSGFIQYVFDEQGVTTPRTVSDTWNFGDAVDEPSIGDLVFFETYKPGPSHMGVYIGNGQFVHAGESRGVDIGELDAPYWQERFLGAKRIQ